MHLFVARPWARAVLICAPLAACGGGGAEGSEAAEVGEEGETCEPLEPPVIPDGEDLENFAEDELELLTLIDHRAWEPLDAVLDPLAEYRPAVVECGVAGWYLENEDREVEVDTNFCNYLALRQPSLQAIRPGQVLRVNFYHFDLVAPEAAQGRLRLSVDGHVIWDYIVEIAEDPTGETNGARAPAVFAEEAVIADFCAPEGADVMLHVYNHGQNTWALRDVQVSRPE